MRYTHTRGDWVDPRYPVTGPAFDWASIDLVPIHYTAAAKMPADIAAYLRAIHRDYLNRRTPSTPNGYSIGYNAAVDQLGRTWELRGDTYRCAANGSPSNHHSFAVLVLVDGQDECNPAMVAAVRDLAAQIRTRKPNARIVGHRDINATQCPGTGVYAQVAAGTFEPVAPPPDPTPTPPAPEPALIEEDDMTRKWIACKLANGSYWLGDGDSCRWASSKMIDAHIAAGPVVDASTGKRIASTAGLTVVSPAVRDFLLGAVDPAKPTTAPTGA